MQFEFSTAGSIVFGQGTIRTLPDRVSGWGRRSLVITGSTSDRAAMLIDGLHNTGISTAVFQVGVEPTTEIITEGVTLARIE
ncbi:MAG TPA: iron-containing alcohol dehydrogenase, partial [Deltaproteobacteria bacterium]|nr:iron-containing alcohol dehydrogenase [Deltaproteobacteria bacterium]